MLIKSLHLKNILSFRDARLDLQPLNVLIGANGSGKSNLIDVIATVAGGTGRSWRRFLRRNGPTGDWVWKGPGREETPFHLADVAARFDKPAGLFNYAYELQILIGDDRVRSLTERFDLMAAERKTAYARHFFQAANENARLWPTRLANTPSDYDEPVTVDVARGKSVLSEISNPCRISRDHRHRSSALRDKGLSQLARLAATVPVRSPQRTDGDPNFLEEDFSNLTLVVNDLLSRRLEPSLDSYLKRFYESYESLHSRIFGNTVELIVNETGTSSALPASRLSDGTIRFIALLAILCHPEPPPLICIEEPEIAMHPDSQDLVVELLRKASERTQLIVTTHSPWLIGRLSAEPEHVVVCDMDATEGTRLHRLSHKEVEDWFDGDRDLGDIWMSGAIKGVMW